MKAIIASSFIWLDFQHDFFTGIKTSSRKDPILTMIMQKSDMDQYDLAIHHDVVITGQ
jgi:hypothetical protein